MYCTLLNQCLSILHVSGKASSNVHDDSSDDETKASKSSKKKITKASAKSAVSTKKKSAPLCNKNPFVAKAARQMEKAKAAEMSLAAAKKKRKGTKKTTLKKSRKYDVDFEEDVEDDATVLDSSDDEESGKQHCRGCSHQCNCLIFYQRMF